MEEGNASSQEPQGSGSKAGIIAAVIIILVAAGVYVVLRNTPAQEAVNQAQVETSGQDTENTNNEQSAPGTGEIKTFNVDGNNFSFSLNEIRVKKGDTVKIVFNNKVGFHDWVIDEFNARTKQIQAGQTEEVTFVADKTGTFEYYCSVGQHRAMGMKGNLIVE